VRGLVLEHIDFINGSIIEMDGTISSVLDDPFEIEMNRVC
jgi:hypothetical protein